MRALLAFLERWHRRNATRWNPHHHGRPRDQEDQMSDVPAQDRTQGDERPVEAPSNVPAVSGAREAQYAEAIRHLNFPTGPFVDSISERATATIVRAVLPLVDAEVAAAVSEAQAETERLAFAYEMEHKGALIYRDRAHSAEAESHPQQVRAGLVSGRVTPGEVERLREGIRALADRWDKPLAGARQRYNGSDEFHDIVEEEAHRRKHAKELRALLSPSPAATTGEAGHNLLASDCRKRTEGWIAGNSCSVCAPAPVSSGEAATGEAACNCGWGGVHDPDNPRCDANRPAPVVTPSAEGSE